MYNKENSKEQHQVKRNIKSALWGMIAAMILFIILIVGISLIMLSDSVDNELLKPLCMIAGLMSVFVGGIVAGKKNGQNGVVEGALFGLAVFLLILIISLIIKGGEVKLFSSKALLTMIGTVGIGGVGGILGVNIKKKR